MTERVEIAIGGIRVGHAQDPDAATGVSVILFDRPVPASMRLCGKATSTRQVDALREDHIVERIDAFCLTGGSAFGLDATGGVLTHLEAAGRGLATPYGRVPICPSAALFDLGLGRFDVRPDAEMARQACHAARADWLEVGTVGAGTGASVGKVNTVSHAMKGGFGSAVSREGALVAQAFVAMNGFGDVLDPQSGEILAGARTSAEGIELADTMAVLARGAPKGRFGENENTVLVAIVTNATLDKRGCAAAATLAEAGLTRVMRPAMAPFDGDVIFLASTREVAATVAAVGKLAAEALAKACVNAVQSASGLCGLMSVRERRARVEQNRG